MSYAETIIQVYENAFDKITKRVLTYAKKEEYKIQSDMRILQDINLIIAKLQKELLNYDSFLIDIYESARQEQLQQLIDAGINFELAPNFDKIHTEVVEELTKRYILQKKHIIQQVKSNAVEQVKLIGTDLAVKLETRAITMSELDNELEKLAGFKIKINDRQMDASSYTKMFVNSIIDSAKNKSLINTSLEIDNDLIRMSYHTSACSICAPFEGKIYSYSGESKKYPPLSVINDGAVINFGIVHPNCKHRFTAYIEGYSKTEKQTQTEFNRRKREKELQEEKRNEYIEKKNKLKAEFAKALKQQELANKYLKK